MAEVPKLVEERLARAKESMSKERSSANEAFEFWRGNQYVYVNSQNYLIQQGTVTNPDGTGKPRHRVRQTRNLIQPIIEAKVSATTQRVPGYEIAASSNDADDIAAAGISTKVALFGYTKWGLRRVSVKTVTHALVSGEGFAMPYFDSSVGPFVDVDGRKVGQGEIKVKVFGKNEVAWEKGVDFEDSPWFVIVQGRTVQQVKALPNYVGPNELDFDAKSSEILGADKQGEKLVLVFEYIERPSKQEPNGKRLIIANGKVVCEPEDYPCRNRNGEAEDMPVLHRLSYTTDPEADRDRGLVPHLIDTQRTFNDCGNKEVELKNLALFVQSYGLPNVLRGKKTDEPGAHYIVNSMDGIKFLDPPSPQILDHLLRIKADAKEDMWTIAWANEIPSQVESGKGIQEILAQINEAWAHFIADYADWHAAVMKHCLYLAQNHYTEPRLIKVRGDTGWEPTQDFQGAQLKDQIDVRVDPSTVVKKSKAELRQEIMNIVQTFPGFLSPEEAIRAMETGRAEAIIETYNNDLSRVNRIIQRIKAGPEELFSMPPRPVLPNETPPLDPETGLPASEVPGWMPRPFDNVAVHKAKLESWLKTPDYEDSPPEVQETANVYYSALIQIELQKAAEAAAAQALQAEEQGMGNAAKTPVKPMPSLPALNGQQ